MKIRDKLSLLFILCSTLSLLLCGILLLRVADRHMVQSAENNAISELNMLKTSFSSSASRDVSEGSTDAARRSLLIFVFQ